MSSLSRKIVEIQKFCQHGKVTSRFSWTNRKLTFFAFLGSRFVQIFGKILLMRVETLCNTNWQHQVIKNEKGTPPVDMRRSKTTLLGVSLCRGNHCSFAFVLWCFYYSVSFQSFVFSHLVIASVRDTKNLPLCLSSLTQKRRLQHNIFLHKPQYGITPLSNRPHFLWVYRRDNPRGMLEEREKSL